MNADAALLGSLAIPVALAGLVLVCARPPGLRDTAQLLGSFAIAACVARLFVAAGRAEEVRVTLMQPLAGVDLAFAVEPLGALVAALIAGLMVLSATHAVGYVRVGGEARAARLFALLNLVCAAAIAVALSANVFTLFVSYQALILLVFPLIAFDGEQESRRAAQRFLAVVLAASMGLLLPAVVWTHAVAGSFDFQRGSGLANRIDDLSANIILALFVFGLALAAMPPLGQWWTSLSKAPFSALPPLFAFVLPPAAGVAVLKVVVFVFGAAMEQARPIAGVMIVVAGAGMCVAALLALAREDIRDRMALSSMAQILAVTVGALLALPMGIFAAALQLTALACAGGTLLMAAGTTAAVTGRWRVSEYAGLGRIMPWTFAGLAVAAASMIGLPPFAGAWAKLWLIAAGAGSGNILAAAMIALSAVLTFIHLGPMAANAFAGRAPVDAFKVADGASVWLVAPVVLGAAATLWLVLFADPLATYLSPIWTAPS